MNNCKKCEHFPVCMWNGQKQDDCGFYKEERPTGHWIDTGGDDWICSECGVATSTDEDYRPMDERNLKMNFCHYCGADMRGK